MPFTEYRGTSTIAGFAIDSRDMVIDMRHTKGPAAKENIVAKSYTKWHRAETTKARAKALQKVTEDWYSKYRSGYCPGAEDEGMPAGSECGLKSEDEKEEA